jgi:hypothetical protein
MFQKSSARNANASIHQRLSLEKIQFATGCKFCILRFEIENVAFGAP